MRLRNRLLAFLLLLLPLLAGALAFQRGRFRGYYDEDAMPPDAGEQTEWAFARLQYPSFGGGYYRGWSWATDYPKAERQFVQGVRRLTRLHTRSVEEVVDLDSDNIYDWPWIYAVEVGRWELSDKQAAKLRDYLQRGGFLLVDDFHGSREWAIFMASLSRVFPDRVIADIPNSDPIFHVLYDLDERFQVPGISYLNSGSTFQRDGFRAEWKGIYDDQGRLMVAICHNMDLGDAWEWADLPQYPEKFTSLAYRIGINYIVYSMTH
ncbi:MAG: DUF4159 domain-containing protein [Candidatus Korobacteraceae bacterium]